MLTELADQNVSTYYENVFILGEYQIKCCRGVFPESEISVSGGIFAARHQIDSTYTTHVKRVTPSFRYKFLMKSKIMRGICRKGHGRYVTQMYTVE